MVFSIKTIESILLVSLLISTIFVVKSFVKNYKLTAQCQNQVIHAPVSLGELIDKITILQIKSEKIKETKKLENIIKELNYLKSTCESCDYKSNDLDNLSNELKNINSILWETEDKIRDKEKDKLFDQEFIELARLVYITNDKRAAVKFKINTLFNSQIVEEKSYSSY